LTHSICLETSVLLFSRPAASHAPQPKIDDRRRVRGDASMLAAVAGVLAAFGSFLVLAVVVGAAGLAIVGMPLDLAPRDWHRLGTVIALGAALVSLLAYLFGGYVAARLGGRDGLQHGLRVFALAVVVLGLLGLLLLGMAGPVSVGTGLRRPSVSAAPGQGLTFGDVATKAAIWSLIAMLLGSIAGGMLGGRAHHRRAEAAQPPPGPERQGPASGP
jgi:MFS family permease